MHWHPSEFPPPTDAPGLAAFWIGRDPVLVWGDGHVRWGAEAGRPAGDAVVDGALCPSGEALILLTGDARLVRLRADLRVEPLADLGGAWADRLAVDPVARRIAVATSSEVLVLDAGDGAVVARVRPPRAPTALFLRSQGDRQAAALRSLSLAVAHGGGVSIHDLSGAGRPDRLQEAPGGHFGVTISPDGRFALAASSEPALVGWRLGDGQPFRMGGYPEAPTGLSWVAGGQFLATTGGPAALLWPFAGADGPMGARAQMHRSRLGLVTAVASARKLLAVGWADGGVDMIDTGAGRAWMAGGPEPPEDLEGDPRASPQRVVSVALAPDGKAVAWVREDGTGGTARP